MITNNLINSKRQSIYAGYVAPPNYVWGVGDSRLGQLDNNIHSAQPNQIGSLTDWSKIYGNGSTVYAIKSNGTLWVWGDNSFGQLGLNLSVVGQHRSSPVQVGTLTDWNELALMNSNANHVHAIKTNGTLWAWGSGTEYQLGQGTFSSVSSPIQIGSDTNWSRVADGSNYTVAIKTNGTLWSCGGNGSGQLGLNDRTNRSLLTQVGSATDWSRVACGGSHTMAIKTTGALWAWGANGSGQLGTGNTISISSPVQIGTDTNWSSIICGFNWTIALKTNGTLWAWGSNGNGNLGTGNSTSYSSPIQIGTLTNWSSIIATGNTVHAIKTDGTRWAWGSNTFVEYGDATNIWRSSPIQIGTDTNWKSIAGTFNSVLALKTNNTLWSWGGRSDLNNMGLGPIGTIARIVMYSSPIQISTVSNISMVSHESTAVHVIRKNGELWSWGFNTSVNNAESGQIGDSTTEFRPTPIQIGTDTNWKQIASGDRHTVSIKTNGTLWAWGGNSQGELGDNTTTSKSSPIQIGIETNWAYISCGGTSTFAIKTDGTLWAWGSNFSSNLGTGNTTAYSSPIQIGSLTNWSKVFAGASHTIAIKTDGTLWSWGTANQGQLGNLNTVTRNSPVQVSTSFTDWSSVACGGSYTIAIRSNGTLWSWGTTQNGVSGRGNFMSSVSSPVQVGSLTDWKTVHCSSTGQNIIAVKTNGTLWGWGFNERGQLGLGDLVARSSPVQIGTLTGWVSGSVGQFTSFFLPQ